MGTLSNVIHTIRHANVVPPAKVNYGLSDGLAPPYISVQDYQDEVAERDTGGPVLKEARYRVVVIAVTPEEAEALADGVDAVLDQQRVTPEAVLSFRGVRRVGQMAEAKYQYGAETEYQLQESLRTS